MGSLRDWLRARKALKMGRSPQQADADNQTSAASSYESWDFHQKPARVGNAAQQYNPDWKRGTGNISQF